MEFIAIPSLVIVLSLWVVHSIFLNRRLLQSQNRYQQFFNDSPVAHIVIDKHHKILEWNEAAEIIFGWHYDQVIGEDIIDFLVPEFDKAHVHTILNKASTDGLSHSKNYNITDHYKEIFCEWRNRLLEGTDGEILCMAQDITVSQKTLDDLHKRSTALESAGDAIFYTDEKGFIEFANRSFFFLGISDPDTVYGNHIGTFLFEDRLTFSTLKSQFNAKQTWRGRITKSFGGKSKVLSVTITAIYHRSRLVSYIANLHDITALSSHVEALTHRVQYDALTGALNRTAMNDRLSQALLRAQRNGNKIALYFIDLNDFKQINDQYGHEAGDILLRSVGQNLQACLRNTDTVCRYGGDEFIVFIEDIKGKNHLDTIRETIQIAITEPIVLEEETIIYPHASIGMALYPDDAMDEENLIRAADISMYTAKKSKHLSVPAPILFADNHNH